MGRVAMMRNSNPYGGQRLPSTVRGSSRRLSLCALLLALVLSLLVACSGPERDQNGLTSADRTAYHRLNKAISSEFPSMWGTPFYVTLTRNDTAPWFINAWGIHAQLHLTLGMYYIETGVILEYDAVVDYLSREFEEDGSRRLYNSGRHPEIEAFVNWANEDEDWYVFQDRRFAMFEALSKLYVDFRLTHETREGELPGFRCHPGSLPFERALFQLSPDALDVLLSAHASEADSVDLTGLLYMGPDWAHLEAIRAESFRRIELDPNDLPMDFYRMLVDGEERGGLTRIFGDAMGLWDAYLRGYSYLDFSDAVWLTMDELDQALPCP